MQEYRDVKFDENELDMLVDRIRNLNINTKKNRKQHIEQIKRHVKDTDIKIANGICPKCGGLLVKRNGKYGTFMGCSNYPRCKYTK